MTNDSEKSGSAPVVKASLLQRISRRHALAALGVLLLFDVLFYVFAVRPLSAREERTLAGIEQLTRQVEEKTSEVEKLRQVVEKVETARETGNDLLEEITISRRVTFSTLVSELDQAASESNIQDRDRTYSMEPIEGVEEYGIVRINANFRGQYENLVRFLNRIDRSERFMIIESLGASPRSDSAELQVTMLVDTFVRDL